MQLAFFEIAFGVYDGKGNKHTRINRSVEDKRGAASQSRSKYGHGSGCSLRASTDTTHSKHQHEKSHGEQEDQARGTAEGTGAKRENDGSCKFESQPRTEATARSELRFA